MHFRGEYEGDVHPDENEVGAYVYKQMTELEKEIMEQPQIFTTWFKIAFTKIQKWWRERYQDRS